MNHSVLIVLCGLSFIQSKFSISKCSYTMIYFLSFVIIFHSTIGRHGTVDEMIFPGYIKFKSNQNTFIFPLLSELNYSSHRGISTLKPIVHPSLPREIVPKDDDEYFIKKFFSNEQLLEYTQILSILKRVAKDDKLGYNKKLKL